MLCVCVFSYCTCVVQRHVTAWFLSLWNFSLGAVRRDWGGAVCDPCFIIRLVTGYSAWWAVTDTWHSQSLLAARQSRQVVNSSRGGPGWATSPQKWRILLKRFMKLHIQVWNKFAHQRKEFMVEGKHLINFFPEEMCCHCLKTMMKTSVLISLWDLQLSNDTFYYYYN